MSRTLPGVRDIMPATTFDTIYEFSGAQSFNVATAAPGDSGYNGGRWRVEVVSYAVDYASALGRLRRQRFGRFRLCGRSRGGDRGRRDHHERRAVIRLPGDPAAPLIGNADTVAAFLRTIWARRVADLGLCAPR
jgi:hypothetical protein